MFSSRFPPRCLVTRRTALFPTVVMSVLPVTLWAQAKIQARAADRFVDSIGVNVHMEYTNTPYGSYPLINERLRELGMRHIRDEINNPTDPFVDELNAIGSLGYKLCGVIEGGNDYPPAGDTLEASKVVPIIERLLPTIDAVEGPNEPDDPTTPPFQYGPNFEIYPQGAVDESQDLWSIVKHNPYLRHLPVLAMSEGTPQDFAQLAAITPPPTDYTTYGNLHAYQGGFFADWGLTDLYIPTARLLTGAKPLWTTEMGYHNNTHFLTDGQQQGVSERASAIYLPIAFLSGFNRGIRRTFSYELIDEFSDPGFTSGEGHYGLLDYYGNPKPAFTAIQNLIQILREPPANHFDPGSLAITFEGAPATMDYTLLQKSNGDYYLAIWNDVMVYQIANSKKAAHDLYPPRAPVTLKFSTPHNFEVYAPNDPSGVHPTGTYTIATTDRAIRIDLPAKVLLIKITRDRRIN